MKSNRIDPSMALNLFPGVFTSIGDCLYFVDQSISVKPYRCIILYSTSRASQYKIVPSYLEETNMMNIQYEPYMNFMLEEGVVTTGIFQTTYDIKLSDKFCLMLLDIGFLGIYYISDTTSDLVHYDLVGIRRRQTIKNIAACN